MQLSNWKINWTIDWFLLSLVLNYGFFTNFWWDSDWRINTYQKEIINLIFYYIVYENWRRIFVIHSNNSIILNCTSLDEKCESSKKNKPSWKKMNKYEFYSDFFYLFTLRERKREHRFKAICETQISVLNIFGYLWYLFFRVQIVSDDPSIC